MRKATIVIMSLVLSISVNAQNTDWVDQMNDPNANFYTIKQSFENYWDGKEIEKGKGHKQFMRWANFWEARVYPEGNFPDMRVLAQSFNQVQNSGGSNLGQWQPMGPYNGSTIGSTMGIGRINRVIFHPNDHQIVFACTPAGGLWKSTDGGTTWSTNTDQLTNLGVSDLAINPLNPDVMYMATGDRDGGDTYSYGILKTTDGGASWNPTGLSIGISFAVRVQNVYVSPADTSVVLVASRAGIYRSTDGAASFTRVQTGSYNNMIQKVGNTNVLFSTSLSGSGCRIYRSNDMGLTWNVLTDPTLPTSNSRRIELAVTPHDSNYIYAVVGNSNNGLEGVYRSTNGGVSWTQVLDGGTKNLLGWSSNGNDSGGQAWYDLAIAVNPQDKQEIFVGGVNIWRSGNGGNSWNIAAHWYGAGSAPFVHADIHHLIYQPVTNHLYAGTDGGVYRDIPFQTSWDELNDGMNITQYYKLSAGASDTAVMLGGAQDNGSHRYKNGIWKVVKGGDGMDNAINPKNPNIMFAASQYGNFSKSINGGNNFTASFNLPAGVNGSGGWVTPIELDPKHPDTVYIGYSRLYRSYNSGVSFTTASPSGLTGGADIDVIAISPSHTEVIYIAEGNNLWRSGNRGGNWANRSNNIIGSNSITHIAVHPRDPNHIYITRSGYSSSQKVQESLDGGQSWTSISTGLPNVPANCITIEDNIELGMYVGTDLGVYYRDSVNPSWVAFNAGLPNVIVNELEVNYNNRKLRAATYGRGMWQTPLFGDLVAPEAKAIFPTAVCVGDTVDLMDNSDYNPSSFNWYIEPATYSYVNGTSSTSQNPQVVFSQSGFYNISLVVDNGIGIDSAYFASAVVAGGLPLPYSNNFNQLDDLTEWQYEPVSPGWEAVSSSQGMSFRADLFNNPTSGARYNLTSPAVNLTGHDSVELSFDYAYSGALNSADDSLLVYVADNCADNWTLVASYGENGSNSFKTTAGIASSFNPGASDWCGNGSAGCKTVSLYNYSGMEGVRVRFVAVNSGDNHIYLDNVKIEGKSLSAPSVAFSSATQVCAMDSISFYDQTYGSPDTYQWTFTGPVTLVSSDRNPKILFTQAGNYDVKFVASNSIGSDSVVLSSYIQVDPADSVSSMITATLDTICPGNDFTVSLSGANFGSSPRITWYVNGQAVSTGGDVTLDFKNLVDGDLVHAEIKSSLACAFPDRASTNVITVHTYPNLILQMNLPNLMCTTDSAFALVGIPAGGTFSGNGVVNGSFDPAIAGTGSSPVTYTLTTGSGCTYTTTKYVGVTQPISLSVSGNEQSCELGDPVSLSVGQPAGGQYSGPGVYNNMFYPDSVSGVGTYPLTYSYFSTICGTSSIGFNMVVQSAPAAPGVIVHSSYLECDRTASSYQWYDSNGAISGETSKTFTPSVDGQYRVEISDNQGCKATSQDAGFFIGIKDLPVGFDFKLYPNPSTDILNVDLQALSDYDLDLKIYDQLGSLVVSRDLTVAGSLNESVDVSNLAAGVYLFTLEGEEVDIRQKIIIK